MLGRIARFLRSKSIDQGVDFRNGEASHPDVEIQIDFEQAFELFGEQPSSQPAFIASLLSAST